MNRREFKENLFYTAIFTLFVGIGAFVLLQIFGIEFGPRPVPGPQTETVKLVLYHSDGDFDVKRVGEWVLIDTGELVQVKRNRIRPNRQYTGGYQEFSLAKRAPPKSGTLPMLLDRETGVACLGGKCTWVYAICPHFSKISHGEKCATFSNR